MYLHVFSMFSPHDVLSPSLCVMSKCFVFLRVIYVSYDHDGKMVCSTVKEKGAKNVIVILLFIVCILSHFKSL